MISGLASREEVFALLASWAEQGWLRELDRSLALFFAELDTQASPLVLLAAALASHQLGQGHICLDLSLTLAQPDESLSLPADVGKTSSPRQLPSRLLANLSLQDWTSACRNSQLLQESDNEIAPLVLSGNCLYLRRYWDYECRVGRRLAERLSTTLQTPDDLPQRLNQLFPKTQEQNQVDWQKLACALAVSGRFTLITGGPGTGKTTTVVRLLALLQGAALDQGAPLRLSLAAPTGKAAARLTESISVQVDSLPVADVLKGQIPKEVTTLHRLLGSRPDSRHFRHHAANLLPLDVLVVDEASMIDLEMMANLLDALPQHARLILLGDKDQLASVEAGAVLGDLCRDAELGNYSAASVAWLTEQTGESLVNCGLQPGQGALAQHILMLRHSRRFAADSGIGCLAQAVNGGEPMAARQSFSTASKDLHCLRLSSADDQAFESLLLEGLPNGQPGYAQYLQILHEQRPACSATQEHWDDWAIQVLTAFDRFQLLCAVRKGTWGVEELNRRIARALLKRGLIDQEHGWYEGRPVLVTRNDYSLGLMNGDIGIALRQPEMGLEEEGVSRHSVLRVVFPSSREAGKLRRILPSRLSSVESVYAMTVHKAQGSEFAHCALVLPDVLNPVLTRELIYTGVTRARECFSLVESRPGIFETAIQRRVVRRSGLWERLQ